MLLYIVKYSIAFCRIVYHFPLTEEQVSREPLAGLQERTGPSHGPEMRRGGHAPPLQQPVGGGDEDPCQLQPHPDLRAGPPGTPRGVCPRPGGPRQKGLSGVGLFTIIGLFCLQSLQAYDIKN